MGRLVIDQSLCVACRNCVIACAVDRHSLSKNLLGAIRETPKPHPRVRVVTSATGSMPVQCRHCSPAPCVMACPSGAMSTDKDGIVKVNHLRCIKCHMCVAACPFGVCHISHDDRSVIKCDLCENREIPACADSCPTGAIKYEILCPRAGGESF